MTNRQDCGLGRTGFSRGSSVRAWRRGQGFRGKARGPRSREAEEGRGKGATALSMSRSLPALCLSVCFLCLFPSIFFAVPPNFSFLFPFSLWLSVSQCVCDYLPLPLYLPLSLCLSLPLYLPDTLLSSVSQHISH